MSNSKSNISKLALGTVQFGLNYGIYNTRGQVPFKEVDAILSFAWEHGISVVDTSYVYGESEKVLGRHHKKNKTPFKIVSKLPKVSLLELEKTFGESLNRLQREEIYGYLLHDFSSYEENPKIFSRLEKLKKQGRVQKVGFSLYYPSQLEKILKDKISFSIIQVPYNIFDRRFEPYFERLKLNAVEIHVRSVFLQGMVFFEPTLLPSYFKKMKTKLILLRKIAEKLKGEVETICLHFILNNNFIDKIVIGVDTLDNLKNNVDSVAMPISLDTVRSQLDKLQVNDEELLVPTFWPK